MKRPILLGFLTVLLVMGIGSVDVSQDKISPDRFETFNVSQDEISPDRFETFADWCHHRDRYKNRSRLTMHV